MIVKKLINKFLAFVKRRWKIILVIFLVGGGTFLFVRNKQIKNQPQLTFIHPQRENLTQTLEVPGRITAKQKALLRFIAGGKLTYLGTQEGSWVNKWQTIATIDRRDLQKRLEQDLNNYMKERWDWDQLLDDTKDRWLPKDEERDKDQDQWDLENKVIDVELRDIAISNTVMSAPFAGIILSAPTQTAGVILLATDYFELVDPTTLIFSAEVDEEDIAKIKLNQTGRLILDSYPDETLNTSLKYISYQAQQTAGGTVFEIEFPISLNHLNTFFYSDASAQEASTSTKTTQSLIADPMLYQQLLGKFRLGMNGNVSIELATRENVLTIPLLATRERDNKTYVDLKNADGITSEREIKIGLETDEKVEVLEGLTESDEIVLPE